MSNQLPELPTRPKARHLIDFDAPRPARDREAEERSLSRVQRWVMSTLAVTTMLHFAIGILFAATYVPELSGRIVLCLISGTFGAISVAAGLAIHGRSVLSPWLLLGILPGIVGAWIFVF